ncbi:hypothetical protein ZIOFF_058828 [Zingiber officinale]|uniref:Auxin-responsive protein n=1 Tax=Zingiber officinale TaxID=94328 RepID=A0A8J5F8Q9_ZINOF|nr:hypothetical protein ZIOFF_058828 [Zingiber officinale]
MRSTMKSSTQFKLDHPPRQEEGSLKFELLPSQADLSLANHGLELSLGITSSTTASGTTTTSSKATCKTWAISPLPETLLHNGFIHPWSLAARQHKAVLEQLAHRKHDRTTTSSPPSSSSSSLLPRVDGSLLLPVVGWPPVKAHRKNNVDTLNLWKFDHEMKESKSDPKRLKLKEMNDKAQSVFVKVKMEGYSVGRKVNIKAHDGYRSLLRALSKLFHNFLSVNYSKKFEDQSEEDFSDDFILLYEDNEGDQMLVGDIPWELFITSVKKLFIVQNSNKAVHAGESQRNPLEATVDDRTDLYGVCKEVLMKTDGRKSICIVG